MDSKKVPRKPVRLIAFKEINPDLLQRLRPQSLPPDRGEVDAPPTVNACVGNLAICMQYPMAATLGTDLSPHAFPSTPSADRAREGFCDLKAWMLSWQDMAGIKALPHHIAILSGT